MTPPNVPERVSEEEIEGIRRMLSGRYMPPPLAVATRLVVGMLAHIDWQAAEIERLRAEVEEMDERLTQEFGPLIPKVDAS